MEQKELEILIEELRALPKESEWIEFKKNNYNPQTIGEYISALSNSACLENKEFSYLVFGIEDNTHQIIGTSFNQSLRERLNIDKKNYPIVSRIIKEAIEMGTIVEYENSRMYVPFWAH